MRVTLNHTEDIANDTRTFWFEPQHKLRYSAGQFVELSLPDAGIPAPDNQRRFTLSSSPTEALLGITTKKAITYDSPFKSALFGLRPGAQATMSEALGDFILPKDTTIPLVFVAAGIGITPIRSMVKWLHDIQERRSIHLIYGAHDVDHVFFRELFADYGLPTTIVLSHPPRGWRSETGRLDAARVLEFAPDVDEKLYYLSGPEPLIQDIADGLRAAGVAGHRLVADHFLGYREI
jgi:ferredoxin-NADP reductase